MEGENRERKRREEREGENLSKLLFWGKECDPFLRVHGVWVAKDLWRTSMFTKLQLWRDHGLLTSERYWMGTLGSFTLKQTPVYLFLVSSYWTDLLLYLTQYYCSQRCTLYLHLELSSSVVGAVVGGGIQRTTAIDKPWKGWDSEPGTPRLTTPSLHPFTLPISLKLLGGLLLA